jgi:hypothetical protein
MPPIFKMDNQTPLSKFLASYENYFVGKYKGDSYDKTQNLAEFLEGDLFTVYNVRGGRKLKYDVMKKELLSYFKKRKVGGKKYWRKQLSEATLEDGEGLDIYGMRLIKLAELAYPTDKKESASQLRQHFFRTIPSTVTTKVLDAERALRATSGGRKKHLTFNCIMDMARDL